MTLTGDKSLKMDFLFFFLRSHLNLALFAPNSIQNWEIKKIRWVCHNLPGPFNYLGCQKGHLLHFEKFAVVVVGSRDYDIRQKLLTIASNMNQFNFSTFWKKSLQWWWWAVGTIDSTLVLRLGLDWTGLGLGLDNMIDTGTYFSCFL